MRSILGVSRLLLPIENLLAHRGAAGGFAVATRSVEQVPGNFAKTCLTLLAKAHADLNVSRVGGVDRNPNVHCRADLAAREDPTCARESCLMYRRQSRTIFAYDSQASSTPVPGVHR